jgi:hypothetical protein
MPTNLNEMNKWNIDQRDLPPQRCSLDTDDKNPPKANKKIPKSNWGKSSTKLASEMNPPARVAMKMMQQTQQTRVSPQPAHHKGKK